VKKRLAVPEGRRLCGLRVGGVCEGPPVPRHEFVPPCCWPVICDFGDDIGDIGLGFDAVHFAGLDDGIDGGGAFAADL
jgi:hypothetical protein